MEIVPFTLAGAEGISPVTYLCDNESRNCVLTQNILDCAKDGKVIALTENFDVYYHHLATQVLVVSDRISHLRKLASMCRETEPHVSFFTGNLLDQVVASETKVRFPPIFTFSTHTHTHPFVQRFCSPHTR